MNINHDIVARALNKAGQEPLTDKEWNDMESTRYRLVYQYYFATIQETLANTDWTSQKKRKRLIESEEENLTTFMYMYNLPLDCRKAVSLVNDESYIVEDGYLYTNQKDAILLYISDGYTGEYSFTPSYPQPASQDDFTDDKQFYVYNSEEEKYERSDTYEEGVVYYEIDEQDYNFYGELKNDPLLFEYIETRLAAKIVLKLSGDQNLYRLLYAESEMMENRAVKATSAHGHNKDTGNRYWSDMLGLPSEEDI